MDETHSIASLQVVGDPARAWAGIVALLETTPRVRIVTAGEHYLHAEFTTALMRYVDDVEFLAEAHGGKIAVRSASRVGYGDMEANRERIEWIRAELASRGYVEASP